MHPTALRNCKHFFDVYAEAFHGADTKVIEIGSLDVNGGLRDCCPSSFKYVGVDFVNGKGVDVVLEDPYRLPFHDGSVDIVISSSCFEHSEMFWVLFLEILRILKPHGLFYLNVPSNGDFHRFPVDCWRFYPDSGRALVTWAKYNGMNPALLESFTTQQHEHQWNDFVAVYLKDENKIPVHSGRILKIIKDFSNGLVFGQEGFVNFRAMPEDRRKLVTIKKIISNDIKII